MNKNVFLFCVRNLCGTGEVNYLLNLSDFIKKFVEGTNRRSMFASGNTEEDYKLFEEQLRDVGFADWYLTNNDSFVVYLCDEQNLEGFLLGEYNQDPIESILNNRNDDESIVTTIETYIRCCNWYISTDDSTSAVLDWAKSLYPELVSDMLHEMTFQEAVAALQDKMCFDERKACEDYLEELRVAENKRLTLWNGVRWVLPQGYGFGQKIADRLAAYENTGLTPEDVERLKKPTAEMLSPEELERAFRIRDRQYRMEDARCHLEPYIESGSIPEDRVTDDDLDSLIDWFDDEFDCNIPENQIWDCVIDEYFEDEIAESRRRWTIIEIAYQMLAYPNENSDPQKIKGDLLELLDKVGDNAYDGKLKSAVEAFEHDDIDEVVGFLGEILE